MWTRILTAVALVGWLGGGCSTNKSGLGDGGKSDLRGDSAPGSGGSPGSASGGSNGSGGAAGGGGAVGSGGVVGSGGRTASGGSISSGGGSGTGGASATGGGTASGGASSTGGRSGNGGTSATGGRAGPGGSGGAGAGGAGGSTRCAGLAGLTCPAGQYCEFMPGFCHYPDAAGICATRLTGCTLEYVPVCGCDGNLYTNDCVRRSAGVSKLNDGMCNGEGCPLIPPTPGAPCAMASVACTYTTFDDPGCLHHSICRGDMTWGPRTITCGTP